MRDLQTAVTQLHSTRDWLDLVEREYALVMAKVRLLTETRKAARQQTTEDEK
jgi:hypothetical protein